MITKFMTEVTTRFNPFSPSARSARLFLAQLPPNARQTMAVNTTLLPQKSTEPSSLMLKFSTFENRGGRHSHGPWGDMYPGRDENQAVWLTALRRGRFGDEARLREAYD